MVAEYHAGQITRFRAEYFHQDHLGNTRLGFSDFNQNGRVDLEEEDPNTPLNELEITQESHYYPFGMNQDGPWYAAVAPENKYLYNGKELNADYDIKLMDYGARWYDGAIGRWTAVDPLADIEPSWTPFRYAFNNPITYYDPTGLYEGEAGTYSSDDEDFEEVLAFWGIGTNNQGSEQENEDCCPNDPQNGWERTLIETGGTILIADTGDRAYLDANGNAIEPPEFDNMLHALGSYFSLGALAELKTIQSWKLFRLFSKSDYVNLASAKRTNHILYGDKTGGGHMWSLQTMFNGKTKFPFSWSKEKVMHAISEVSTSGSPWKQQTGQAGSFYTKSGKPARFVAEGMHDGVKIRVVIEPSGDGIITAFPIK